LYRIYDKILLIKFCKTILEEKNEKKLFEFNIDFDDYDDVGACI